MDAEQLAFEPSEEDLDVPPLQQETDFSCGAAALLAVMRYFGQGSELQEADLFDQLQTTPKNGTAPDNIVRVANKLGLHANWRTGIDVHDLQDALESNVPIILDIQATDEVPSEQLTDGHYIVLVGIDDEYIRYMDPSLGDYDSMTLDDFELRWVDVDGPRGGIFVDGGEANGNV